MKHFLLLILFIAPLFKSNAQKCCTDRVHQNKIKEDKDFEKRRAQIQDLIKDILNDTDKDQRGDTIVIPVVFHIIHNKDQVGDQENIVDDLVYAQINQLNDDFNRLNQDANQTPGAFMSSAANCRIEFCMTEIDETGNLADPINRHHINTLPNVSEGDCWTPDYIDNNIIKPTIWDSKKFLNIYSVLAIDEFHNGSCNTFASLGYAQFPGGSADTDAVVLAFYSVGSLAMPNTFFPVFKGRTGTHEVGHWLDLEHPWGPNVSDCNSDDAISDTPNQFDPVFDCPTFPSFDQCTSSGDGVMFMNFMQYVDDDCMNLFTTGQCDWMRSLISAGRPELLTSKCSATTLALESILGLEAIIIDKEIELSWTAARLDQDAEFFIEHSLDASQFQTINSLYIDADDQQMIYTYMHQDPHPGINYYRIRLKEQSGEQSYTRIVSAIFNPEENVFIYPNPSADILNISSPFGDVKARYDIYSINGQLMESEKYLNLAKAINVSDYNIGIYYIRIYTDNREEVYKWTKF